MKRIRCKVCGSYNLVKNNKVFVCLNCGCKFFPTTNYELDYLKEEDAPSIEEILSHKGLNPVTVTKNNGVIKIVDEYTGRSYTAEEYRDYVNEKKHKSRNRSFAFKRFRLKVSHFFASIDWEDIIYSFSKVAVILLIPVFIVLAILGIRNKSPFLVILFQFLIAASAGINVFLCCDEDHWIAALINCGLQIAINHFIIFGSLFSLEFFWRLIIGLVLKLTCYVVICKINNI